ncbi:hypothetical protein BJ912DRAFT_921532 [Pholiota molesta]|nr:hypothetical protein BJ912DRAFT_921532 [Pholiota molesta]
MSTHTCHQTSPRARGPDLLPGAPYRCPTTELAVINSSPRGVGLNARALRRTTRGVHYMLPRSPESPTLQMLRRRQLGASPTLRVSGGTALSLSARQPQPQRVLTNAFPDHIETKGISLHNAPTFDPSSHQTSSFSQLLSLDSLPALGLAGHEFWKLFSKCTGCHRGHEAGVPEAVFRAIFYVCGCCGRYMTKRVSLNHSLREHADSDDSGDEQAACIYRHAASGSKSMWNRTPDSSTSSSILSIVSTGKDMVKKKTTHPMRPLPVQTWYHHGDDLYHNRIGEFTVSEDQWPIFFIQIIQIVRRR